jgi:hypothetical protein
VRVCWDRESTADWTAVTREQQGGILDPSWRQSCLDPLIDWPWCGKERKEARISKGFSRELGRRTQWGNGAVADLD